MSRPPTTKQQLRAVIFDLDGTLVDSALDFAAIRREIGFPEHVGLLEHIETLGCEEEIAKATAIIHRHELAGAEAAEWMPGAAQAVAAIDALGLPMGIVTRNCRAAAMRTCERLEIPEMMLVAREDAPPKPDPTGLLTLAEYWELVPAEVAFIGDFEFDIEAAERAGMVPVLYTAGLPIRCAQRSAQIVDHFDDLVPFINYWHR